MLCIMQVFIQVSTKSFRFKNTIWHCTVCFYSSDNWQVYCSSVTTLTDTLLWMWNDELVIWMWNEMFLKSSPWTMSNSRWSLCLWYKKQPSLAIHNSFALSSVWCTLTATWHPMAELFCRAEKQRTGRQSLQVQPLWFWDRWSKWKVLKWW